MIEPQVTLLDKVNHKTLWGHLDMQGPVTSGASQLDGVAYPASLDQLVFHVKLLKEGVSRQPRAG
jgi:hypothetical protein